jgi:autotransporter adhesin
MNTIYRIVWNVTLGKWVVASELAKGRKKKSSLKTAMLSLAVVGAMAGMGVPSVYAAEVTMPSCVAGEDPHETGCLPTSEEQLMTPFFADGGGNDSGFASSVAIGQGAVTGNSNAVAIGLNAKATNTGNVAIGYDANTAGSNAIGLGYNATANGNYSMSLGGGSSATNVRATAVGTDSVASGNSAVALGNRAAASGDTAVALGNSAAASTGSSVAIGNSASVTIGSFSNAIGANAKVTSNNSNAVGNSSVASAVGTNAFGNAAEARAQEAVAIGHVAKTDAQKSVVIGSGATLSASATGSVALGAGATTDRANAVAVGNGAASNRQIVNLAAGSQDTDAVNLSQLKNTAGTVAAALGGSVTVNADGTITKPSYTVQGTPHDNVGSALGAVDTTLTSIGGRVTKNEGDIVTIDGRVTKNEGDIVTIGDRVTGAETNITNIDGRVTTNEGDIVDIRNQLGSGSMGLVQQDAASRDVTVAAGTDGGRVNFAGTDGARKLVGVAKGEETATSTEAVNGSQLFATNERVTKSEGDIVNLDGRVTKNEGDIVTIGDRVTTAETNITNIDGRVTTNEGDIVDIRNQLGSGSIGLVQQDATSRDITVAAGTDGGRVNFAGTDGARKLAGVAEGELSSTSTEAVNGSQLFATNERVTRSEGDIVNLDGRVTRNEGDIVTIGDRVTGAETNITRIDGRVTTAETNITNIDGRVTKNEGDIIDLGDRINNGSVGLVQQSGANAAVTVAAATGGAVVDFTGTAGARQLKGVSTGADDTDAVNVAQMRDEIGKASAGDTRYFKADGAMDGSDDAINTGSRSVAIGAGSQATADNAVALGAGSVADRANAVSVGSKGNERQIVNVAEGTEDTDAVNLGQLKKAGLVGGDGSTLDAVVYDAGSNRGSVTFGGLGGTKLTNVMAGLVSATSTDAVNGSQLWILQDQVVKLGDRVTNVENGAPVNVPVTPSPAPGEGRDPAFAANGDGGPASATGKDSVAAGTGASAKADNSVAIGAGSVADRADTVSVGSVGAERQISNVAAGTQRTDAANWGQVQDALATANRYTDDRFDGVNRRIGEVQRQANRGIAASAALINVTPYMPGKTVLNAGVANYRGESALGVGVSRWNDSGRVNFNAGMSAAAGDSPIFRMGVGVVLGD